MGLRFQIARNRRSPTSQLAIGPNAPAVLVAIGLNTTLLRRETMYTLWLAAPLIPVLWYGVGRWFDRRLDWVASPKPKRSFLRDAILGLPGCFAVLVLLLVAQVMMRGYPGPPDPLRLGLGVCSWFAFLLTAHGRL